MELTTLYTLVLYFSGVAFAVASRVTIHGKRVAPITKLVIAAGWPVIAIMTVARAMFVSQK